MHFSLPWLIETLGYVGILGIIFAESGLFFAFFLPGDSLLFSAGILAASGALSLPKVVAIVIIGSVFGGIFGYYFGRSVTNTLFKKDDSLFFKKKHLEHTAKFYEQHGIKTVFLARFIPIIRTFAPILAGASLMHHRKFLIWNLIGGVVWSIALPVLGYTLGSKIPHVNSYILPVIIGIMALSLAPVGYRLIKKILMKKNPHN